MNGKQSEFILGRNVTEKAKAQENRSSVVISLRVSGNEFDLLSDVAESEGRTVSQVARKAIQQWLTHRDRETQWVALSFISGTKVFFGDSSGTTYGSGESSKQSGRADHDPATAFVT